MELIELLSSRMRMEFLELLFSRMRMELIELLFSRMWMEVMASLQHLSKIDLLILSRLINKSHVISACKL